MDKDFEEEHEAKVHLLIHNLGQVSSETSIEVVLNQPLATHVTTDASRAEVADITS